MVRHVRDVSKNSEIVRRLEKSRREAMPDLEAERAVRKGGGQGTDGTVLG